MKKLLVLFVAVAATITLSAKSIYYFNRTQFQWSSNPAKFNALVEADNNYDVQLTVPFVYKGKVAFKVDWAYEPALGAMTMSQRENAKCLILNKKSTLPAVMTLCQPCIDCYPCDVLDISDASETGNPKDGVKDTKVGVPYTGVKGGNTFGQPGWITIWNLYIVTDTFKEDGQKYVVVAKINLLADENKGMFFTGAKGKNVYVKAKDADGKVQLQLTGAKNDYKFKYYERYLMKEDMGWGDVDDDVKSATAYIKSAKALNGTIFFNRITTTDDTTADTQVEVLDVVGTVKLTRDATWTGKAVKGAFAAEVQKIAKNWDDCVQTNDADNCEDYFVNSFEEAYFGAAYKKAVILGLDGDPLGEAIAAVEVFEAAYDKEVYFKKFDGEEEEEELP